MKGFQVFTKSLIVVLVLAASAFAQTENNQSTNSGKVAVINTNLFYDEKSGIPELARLQKQFDEEVESKFSSIEISRKEDEKTALVVKINRIGSEIQYLQYKNSDTSDKSAELESLRLKLKQLEMELDSLVESRKQYIETQAPESLKKLKIKIGDAIRQFTKEKGYAIIIDISKDTCICLCTYEYENDIDVTEAFIKYYNEIYTKLKTQ